MPRSLQNVSSWLLPPVLCSSFIPLNSAKYITGKIFGNAQSLLIRVEFVIVHSKFIRVCGLSPVFFKSGNAESVLNVLMCHVHRAKKFFSFVESTFSLLVQRESCKEKGHLAGALCVRGSKVAITRA